MAKRGAGTRKGNGDSQARPTSPESLAKSRSARGRRATGKTVVQELLTVALGAVGLAGAKKLGDSHDSTTPLALPSSVHLPSTSLTANLPSWLGIPAIPIGLIGYTLFAVVCVVVVVVALRLWLQTLNLQWALDSLYSPESQLEVMKEAAAKHDGKWFTRAEVLEALRIRREAMFLQVFDRRATHSGGVGWAPMGFKQGVFQVLGLGKSVAGLLDEVTDSTIKSYVESKLICELPPTDLEAKYCAAPEPKDALQSPAETASVASHPAPAAHRRRPKGQPPGHSSES